MGPSADECGSRRAYKIYITCVCIILEDWYVKREAVLQGQNDIDITTNSYRTNTVHCFRCNITSPLPCEILVVCSIYSALKMAQSSTFLVFGATGGTGKHFVARVLSDGHRVKALVRDPTRLSTSHPNLEAHQGSIIDYQDLDSLVQGVDFVVVMLGDKEAQRTSKVNTTFMKKLVPAMRRNGVRRLLYQAGGLSRPYGGSLTLTLWVIRNTIARGFNGQHEDNEAVMEYLFTEAHDIEWIVHRAGIYGDGESKGLLERSSTAFSIGNFRDCAEYSHRVIRDTEAIHTSDFSLYVKK